MIDFFSISQDVMEFSSKYAFEVQKRTFFHILEHYSGSHKILINPSELKLNLNMYFAPFPIVFSFYE